MKGAHHMGYRLLSGVKNGFILKFSQFFNMPYLSINFCENAHENLLKSPKQSPIDARVLLPACSQPFFFGGDFEECPIIDTMIIYILCELYF